MHQVAGSSPVHPSMTTNEKGATAEALAVGKLVQLGYTVLMPVGVHRYDLAVERQGQFRRVQVKYVADVDKRGTLRVRCYSVGRDSRSHPYQVNEVDAFLVYWAVGGRWYWIEAAELLKSGRRTMLHLRVRPTSNRQVSGVVDAAKYEV